MQTNTLTFKNYSYQKLNDNIVLYSFLIQGKTYHYHSTLPSWIEWGDKLSFKYITIPRINYNVIPHKHFVYCRITKLEHIKSGEKFIDWDPSEDKEKYD